MISFLLPKRMLPIAYLLRALVFIQTVSLVYFAFLGGHFPYTVQGYTSDMYTMRTGSPRADADSVRFDLLRVRLRSRA